MTPDPVQDPSSASAAPPTGASDPWLERCYQQYADRVYRAAYRVTGSSTDAEDVLQTVFLRLARRAPGDSLGEDAGGYLHRAAVHAALDVLRRATLNERRRFLDACERAICADGQVKLAEGELFRAIALTLGVPIPPVAAR